MSENLNSVFCKYFEKIKGGEKGYKLIRCKGNEWVYCSKKYADDIDSINIVIWNNEGVRFSHEWDKEKSIGEEKAISIILKGEKQLILCDDEAGCFAWGVSGKEANLYDAIIVFQSVEVETIIAMSKEKAGITVLNRIIDAEPDALTTILHYLVNRVTVEKKTESGVNEDAGANEPTMDGSIAGWM